MRIGFVGLGHLGSELAGRVIAAGHETVLYDSEPKALERFAGPNVRIASSLSEVAALSDHVAICVVNDDQLREVVDGEEGLLAAPMSAGSLITVHSTVHPDLCVQLAERAASFGISFADVPMSFGSQNAEGVYLMVAIVGADDATFDRCLPVLESMAGSILRAGPVGTAETVKLMNSVLNVANMGSALAAIHLGEELGASRETLVHTLSTGSASSQSLLSLLSVHANVRDDADPYHFCAILKKDLDLAIDVAQRHGIDVSALVSAGESGLDALAEAIRAPLVDGI